MREDMRRSRKTLAPRHGSRESMSFNGATCCVCVCVYVSSRRLRVDAQRVVALGPEPVGAQRHVLGAELLLPNAKKPRRKTQALRQEVASPCLSTGLECCERS